MDMDTTTLGLSIHRPNHLTEQRIPVALQAVFLASNRGKEVNKPPPGSLANKVFRRKSLWQKIRTEGLLRSPIRSPLRRSKSSARKSVIPVPDLSCPPAPLSSEAPRHHISPHAYLSSTVLARGYSNKEFRALETAYFNAPTSYQKSSYGRQLVNLVRQGNVPELRRMLQAGICPNASNMHGETIVHMACRSSHTDCFRLLMSFGANVQVSDNCGRLPLHDACEAKDPSFEIIEMILDEDPRLLFVADLRGNTPLASVRSEKWTPFTRFLMSKKDKYWPDRDFASLGSEKDPALAVAPPNSCPFENHRPEVPLAQLAAVANGIVPPMTFRDSKSSSVSTGSTEVGDSSISDYSDFFELEDEDEDSSDDESDGDEEMEEDDEEESSVHSVNSFDENEMENILNSIGGNVSLQW